MVLSIICLFIHCVFGCSIRSVKNGRKLLFLGSYVVTLLALVRPALLSTLILLSYLGARD